MSVFTLPLLAAANLRAANLRGENELPRQASVVSRPIPSSYWTDLEGCVTRMDLRDQSEILTDKDLLCDGAGKNGHGYTFAALPECFGTVHNMPTNPVVKEAIQKACLRSEIADQCADYPCHTMDAQHQCVRQDGCESVNGCNPTAGYSWCESRGQCVRPWETPCEDVSAECTGKCHTGKYDSVQGRCETLLGCSEEKCNPTAGYSWCESLGECVRPWETPCPVAPAPVPAPEFCADWTMTYCPKMQRCMMPPVDYYECYNYPAEQTTVKEVDFNSHGPVSSAGTGAKLGIYGAYKDGALPKVADTVVVEYGENGEDAILSILEGSARFNGGVGHGSASASVISNNGVTALAYPTAEGNGVAEPITPTKTGFEPANEMPSIETQTTPSSEPVIGAPGLLGR